MKRTALALFFAVCAAANGAVAQSYPESMANAAEAFETEDWPALNDSLDAAQEARPYSLYVYRNRILARLLAGRDDEALALADKAAQRGLTLALAGHPAFEKLKAAPGYAAVTAKMKANEESLGGAGDARAFPDKDLLPEAIAYGPRGTLYIGGVRGGAILKAGNKDEALSQIATAPGGVFDLEIRGRKIWAAVNNQLAYEKAGDTAPFAAVMAFDAKTGGVLRDIRVAEENALLGDLEIAEDGAAYASDSLSPRIYHLAPGGVALEIFAQDTRFVNLQGLALDEENGRLFVADYLAGLFAVSLGTGEARLIANDADAWLGGIDGLYYVNGALIGVQNGTAPQRIVRVTLSEDGTAATGFSVLAQNLEGWSEPTHGAVAADAFHYIAASNWPAYDENGILKDGAALTPLVIMTAPLESP